MDDHETQLNKLMSSLKHLQSAHASNQLSSRTPFSIYISISAWVEVSPYIFILIKCILKAFQSKSQYLRQFFKGTKQAKSISY